ncbi:cystatin isoform X2 [Pantherophis guttatus]|uniref:Cystatin isoform X2 n=1 Tax=Pantherophis guttatus TaxID=94885 RepID=A0ABM3YQW4_PANGU|nr:cystatin isoform X2 [Pantherophis guttatus]
MVPIPAPLCLLCALLMLPSGMPETYGGLSPKPVSDPGVQEAAAFAVEEYNALNAHTHYFKELRIVDAQVQVVSGWLYYLTMELGKTNCEKTGSNRKTYKEIQNCQLSPRAQQENLTCRFEVWSHPWLKKTELTEMSCN